MAKKIVGIIGGMGPEATVDLFKKIIKATPAQKDQDHLHILVDSCPEIPDRTLAILHHVGDPLPSLVRAARNLERAGAQLLAMPCNTAHFYHEGVQSAVGIPLIHMIQETAAAVVRDSRRFQRVGLLATDGTIKTRIYHDVLEAHGLTVMVPDQEVQTQVMAAISGAEGIKAGYMEKPAEAMRHAGMHLASRGAQVIIAGCTEIPLVLQDGDIAIPVLDPTWILATVCVQLAWDHLDRGAGLVWAAIIVCLVFGFDRLTKIWIMSNLMLNQSIPVIQGVFHITYIRNPGGAFGILGHWPGFFILANLLIMLIIIYFYRQAPSPRPRYLIVAVGMQLGGALGNLYDRLVFGQVIDFLDFRIWPVFNVADMGIVCGVILLAWYLLREGMAEGRRS